MDKDKDIWGWVIEIENVFDKTKVNILINSSKGCIYLDKEIANIIQMFRKSDNRITVYWLDNSQNKSKTKLK